MADHVKKLHDEWRRSEKALFALSDEYEGKLDKLRAEYRPRLDELGAETARLQKEYCDADAAAALVGRDDAETVAANLGLTLPDSE